MAYYKQKTNKLNSTYRLLTRLQVERIGAVGAVVVCCVWRFGVQNGRRMAFRIVAVVVCIGVGACGGGGGGGSGEEVGTPVEVEFGERFRGRLLVRIGVDAAQELHRSQVDEVRIGLVCD